MSGIVQIGTPCGDCVDGVCSMNCSSSAAATNREWLAASFWAGVFPKKATAQQVLDWRSDQARGHE